MSLVMRSIPKEMTMIVLSYWILLSMKRLPSLRQEALGTPNLDPHLVRLDHHVIYSMIYDIVCVC